MKQTNDDVRTQSVASLSVGKKNKGEVDDAPKPRTAVVHPYTPHHNYSIIIIDTTALSHHI